MQLSHKLFAFACLFVILLAAFPTFSSAEVSADGSAASTPQVEVSEEQDATSEYEEEVEEVEVEQQMYVMPAADVQTYIKFLGVEDNKFVAGNEVTALIGMTNAGDKTYNVSYVGAHLHSPYDYNFYVQNFTVRWTSNLLPPHSEVTVEYKFRPDEKLEPLDFQLSGWVIYNDSAPTPIIYRNVFFNQTIEVLERRQEWTVQSVFTYALTIAGLAIAGYVASQQLGGKKRRSAASSSATSTEAASAGWDTKVYKPAAVSKAIGPKKHIKPTSNKQ